MNRRSGRRRNGTGCQSALTCDCDGKHSTGQAYKGGPNSGVFPQITGEPNFDLAIPGRKASFGVIESAQALGDFRVFAGRSRLGARRISRMTRLRVLPQSAKRHGWRWRDRCRRSVTYPVAVSPARSAPDKPLRAGK